MHVCQGGNEKLFRPHIIRTDEIAELDVGLEGVGALNTVLGALEASTLQI